MTFYSHNGAEPAELPFRIVMPGGFTRTDRDSFTPEEIAAAGYVAAPAAPEHNPATQHPPVWTDGHWTVADFTAEELAERAAAEHLAMAAAVDAERDRRADAGMTFQGVRYQTRPGDRENANGASTMAIAAIAMGGGEAGDLRWHGEDEDFGWIAEDNSVTPMDAPTTFAFGKAMAAHKSAHIFAARELKNMDPIPADFADDSYWP